MEEDTSVWKRLTGLVNKKSDPMASPKQLDTYTRQCPAGHPMAEDWTNCPYCDSQRQPTGTQAPRPPVSGNNDSGRRKTEVFPDKDSRPAGSSSGPRVTKVFSEPDRREPQDPAGIGRPLTGIVYTYSWSKLGRLYQIGAGRNYAGTADMTAQGEPTDVHVTQDGTMSSTHFLILCQAGKYRISDCNSTNGTFVENELIDQQGTELKDGARIRAGNTVFIFKKVQPPEAEAERPPQGYEPVQAQPRGGSV
jgi:pSer/pThr/pTyr-binding forkhead associated (FHA) protein